MNSSTTTILIINHQVYIFHPLKVKVVHIERQYCMQQKQYHKWRGEDREGTKKPFIFSNMTLNAFISFLIYTYICVGYFYCCMLEKIIVWKSNTRWIKKLFKMTMQIFLVSAINMISVPNCVIKIIYSKIIYYKKDMTFNNT